MRSVSGWLIAAVLLVPAAPTEGADPHIDIERLRRNAPGWVLTRSEGDATQGSTEAEQKIWPMWYVHWYPLEDSVGRNLSAKEARRAVEALWEEPILDGPLDPKPIEMPVHDGFVMETTTSHGERRSRYFVWACPESGRLIVVDTSLNLRVSAPPELLDWQRDMARTLRCHQGAKVESFPHLPLQHEASDVDLAYAHPFTWRPLQTMRVVRTFGEVDMSIRNAVERTRQRGQELVLALDALRHVYFSWGLEGDFPFSYDVLNQEVADYWRERAINMMILDRKVSNDVWIADGIARIHETLPDMPPTHMHKFRVWMWRENGVDYLAVGDVGGVRFGRQRPPLPMETWNLNLEEMFQACVP